MAAITHLFRLAEYLETQTGTTPPRPGYAWTIANTDDMSGVWGRGSSIFTPRQSFFTASEGLMPSDSASQVTASQESQVTVTGPTAVSAVEQTSSTVSGGPVKPNYGALKKDDEGVETRRQLLRRRREECQAEEVDVALAPVMKIPTSYCFYPDQYKAFRRMFPRVNVDPGLSYTHHDHPVAHTATLVGIRAVQNMLKPGERCLDLYGNPNGNEQFNRFQQSRVRRRPQLGPPPVIHSLVGLNSAMDAVRRVTKWGDKFDRDGNERWFESDLSQIKPDSYDTFLSIHTLYYMGMYRVCKLLNEHPGSKMLALVNYSPEQMGTLYGELKFTKNEGVTKQTSPNGESYVHADIDHWFQTNSFTNPHSDVGGGISWTSSNIGGPLYILTITACDPNLATHKPYKLCEAPALKVMGDNTFMGIVKLNGHEVRLRISNADLARELRHFMTFRDRSNPQVFLDLCTKARRLTSVDLVEGSRQYKVDDGELQDHIVYAYLVDAPGELEVLDGVQLLKGELLEPLSKGLRMEGPGNEFKWKDWLMGRKQMPTALGHKSQATPLGFKPDTSNTGGLLPRNRS